jgi:hypothetical protein
VFALLACLLLGLVPPPAHLFDLDGRGCARSIRLGDGPAQRLAAAPDFCVRDALAARLEPDALHAVLLVEPSAGGPRTLFVYRLEQGRLRPRFLGSRLPGYSVEALRGSPGPVLWVDAKDRAGGKAILACRFEGFPLLCEPRRPEP